jgi:hypothetical protein
MLLSIGIVGIYLSKVFAEVKQRPYATVRDVYEPLALNADLTPGTKRGQDVNEFLVRHLGEKK